MKLESERLCFRELQASDADSMFALYSDPQVLRVVGEKPLKHVDQVREIILGAWCEIENPGLQVKG